MELTKGLVVRALAGRDMGKFFRGAVGGRRICPHRRRQTAEARFSETEKISVISSGRISSWNWTVSRIKSSEMC